MESKSRTRHTIFVLLGILVLILKNQYSGPYAEFFYNYGSNFSVSFAIYFIGMLGFRSFQQTRLISGIGALLAVELFELLDGFGVMENVYDPWDLLANALGIGLAVGVDLLTDRSKN
jgi:hypothetical protein